jgi:hypothetical protein
MAAPSGEELERLREARTDAQRAEVAPIGGEHAVNPAPLRNGGHSTVDQPEIEIL